MSDLASPERLEALRATGLMNTLPEPAFDRVIQIASRLVGAPIAAVTLLDDKRQLLKGALGVGESLMRTRETSLEEALCRIVVETDAPLTVADGPNDERFALHPAVARNGVTAYLGVPLTTAAGHTLGALCVLDENPRIWSPDEMSILKDLATAVTNDIELRVALAALERQKTFVELLHDAAACANASSTPAEALVACIERICSRLGWSLAHAYITERTPDGLELAPHGMWYAANPERTRPFREVTDRSRFGPGVALPGRVLGTRAPQWVVDVASDPACPRRHAATESGLAGCFAMPVMAGEDVVAVIEMFSDRTLPPDTALLAVMADIGTQLGRVFERARARQQLSDLSLRDELTGLRNRRGFLELARHHLKLAARTQRPASLLFVDLNGMKQINDTLGHEHGDAALRATAHVLTSTFRDTDVIARLGGDELVVLAVDVGPADAVTCRERLLASCAAHNEQSAAPYRLSLSIGIASTEPDARRSIEALLADADSDMYEHKRARRQRAQSAALPIVR